MFKRFSSFISSIYFPIIIGILLRIFHFLKNKPFEFDELVVWNVATKNLNSLIAGNYYEFRFHPPLLYLFIHFWRKFSDSELWLRSISLSTSLVAIILICILFKKIFNKSTAYFGTFLYSLSTFSIWWSSQLRIYQILFTVSIVYLIVYLKILKNNAKNFLWILLLFFGTIGFQLDYSFIWIFVIINIHYLLIVGKNRLDVLSKWIIINFLIFLNFLLYAPIIEKEALISYTGLSTPNLNNLFDLIIELLFSERWILIEQSMRQFLTLIILILLALSLLLLIKNFFIQKYNKSSTLLVLLFFLPIIISLLISQKYPIFISKNLFIVNIGLLLLLSVWLTSFRKHIVFQVIFLLFWSFINLTVLSKFYQKNPDWTKFKTLAKVVPVNNSKILFIPWYYHEEYRYYNQKYNFFPKKQFLKLKSTQDVYNFSISRNNSNFCLIYDTFRHDDFYKRIPKKKIIEYYESFPLKIDIGGGIKVYCKLRNI